MATLVVQKLQPAGMSATYVAAAVAGDNFSNNDTGIFVHIKNGGIGQITVTVEDVGSVSPAGATAFDADVDVNVAAAGERFIGPFDRGRFNDANGRVVLTYSDTANLTLAVLQV